MTSLNDRLKRPGTLWFEASCPDERHGDSLLFSDPVDTLTLSGGDDVHAWFRRLESWIGRGFCLAGWIGYEAGALLDPSLASCTWPTDPSRPLGWFGVYRSPERFDLESEESLNGEGAADGFRVSGLEFDLSEEEYIRRIEAIREEIAAGNVYQVNFTGRFRFSFRGSPQALYAAMKRQQPSPWSACLNTGERTVLSLSPELFFTLDGRRIETMPMKGTAPRGASADEDLASRAGLAVCEKNRAENLMIVDLLRNDLGRVCTPGSIGASGLFETRTYPTLHQMVSTVRGELRERTGLHELFRALFPSGSVTGAPKVSAMNLIRSLETGPRGVYTGAVGFIMPGGRMAFNVAIRTIELEGGRGVYGTGSGIVWDSDPRQEYLECMLKARILSELAEEVPGIFETILWNGAYLLLYDHLDRMASSADALGLQFDRRAATAALERLEAGMSGHGGPHRARLLLDRRSGISASAEPFSPAPSQGPVRVRIAPGRVDSRDPLLRHKVTSRERYDGAYREALDEGYGECLFVNERDEVTEGAISNMVARIDGRWVTPPESSGLLNGVFRRYLLRTRSWLQERVITVDDLGRADLLLLCNALRGIRTAVLDEDREG
ncbi:MAG: aminodeoxychorismate synthase component I [Chlorobiaceae bacterium]|nr:aminodeoxychorismate synthase component I [Chlorobiaceae bacterium]